MRKMKCVLLKEAFLEGRRELAISVLLKLGQMLPNAL